MKKKMIFRAAACMIAALSVVGLNTNKANSSDVTLSDLAMTSDVHAVCADDDPFGWKWFGEGKCIAGWICIFSYGSDTNDCDPYKSHDL